MTEEEKSIKRENFIEWTTFIEDRVDAWSVNIPKQVAELLDYSSESLKVIESYILSNFSLEFVSDEKNKLETDAVISYYGETLRRNLPNSTWYLDLDDESNIDFNLPSIRTPIASPISPYLLIKRIINKNKGTFLYDLYIKRLGFINNPETY
jgi:hypothetical protein